MQHEDMCECNYEVWTCGTMGAAVAVKVDAGGIPIGDKFCKLQAGATALAVAAAATFTMTVTVTNLVWARIRGLVISASDPAAPILASLMDSFVSHIGITGIEVLGSQNISGECNADRWARDATGPGGVGTGSFYKGDLGTAGGTVIVTGINRSAAALNIWTTVDIDGVRSVG